MHNLKTSFFGLKLKNPIIAGSSGLTNSISDIQDIEKAGASAVVLKSLFEEEIRVETEKNMTKMVASGFVYPETMSYFEYDDMDDPLGNYLQFIRDVKKSVKIPVIASINCVTADQWTYFAKQIEEAGADAIELNIFALPTDINRTSQETEDLYFNIIEAVLKQVTIPVNIKMGYFSANLAKLIERISKTKIAGITLFNRFYSPDIDIDNMEITSSNVLSNPDEITMPLRWVGIMSGRVKCQLAASTGIHNGEAVIKQLLAGAGAVQVASTLYRNGVQHINKMLKEVTNWMDQNDYKSVNDFMGKMSQDNSSNPAAFERVQFMKYFREF